MRICTQRRQRSARALFYRWPGGLQFGIGHPDRHAWWAFVVHVKF